MSAPRHSYNRLVAAGATLLVIATPVVLAVSTLAPLESAPRAGRAPVEDEVAPVVAPSADTAEPSNDPRPGGRRGRRNRDRAQDQEETAEPGVATPTP